MDRLLRALDKSADGAFIIDENQCIVHWNPAAQEMLGYAPEEVMGLSCHEILRGQGDQEPFLCRRNCYVIATTRARGGVESFNTCARTKSGQPRWINVSILSVPLVDENGPALVVHLFRDASQEKQIQHFTQQVLNAAKSLRQDAAPTASPAESLAGNLTDRERELLILLARGLSTAEIARSLSITPSTTRNHIQNIFHKLNVHSRAAAVAYAFEHDLVSEE